MAAISTEEENYVRIALLLTGKSPRAVRVLFDNKFPPASLQLTLNQEKSKQLGHLKKIRVIDQAQWDLMFPSTGVPDSKTFDVTLMICLIRSLKSQTVAHPATGFDHLPSAGDITLGADLARIKYYRNYLAHLNDNKIDKSNFTTAWNDISDAVGRLGGSAMYKECQDLKNKILDQSNHEIMLEIRKCMEEVKKAKEKVTHQFKELCRKYEEMEQDMAQITADLEYNKKESETLKVKFHELLKTGAEKNTQEIRRLKERFLEIEQYIAKHELKANEMVQLKANHEQMGKLIEIFKSDDEKKTNEIEEQTIEIGKLKADLELIKTEIENPKETVPWNIRGMTRAT